MLLNFGKIMNYLTFRKLHIFPLPLAPSSQDLLALGESYSTGHSSPRRLAGEKKCDSYNHKTTIWVCHEYYLNPEFHKI